MKSDLGNKYRAQHSTLTKVIRKINKGGIAVQFGMKVDYPTLLTYLLKQGVLKCEQKVSEDELYNTGLALQELYHETKLAPKLTMNIENTSRSNDDMTDYQAQAIQKWNNYMRILGSYAGAVCRVVLAEQYYNQDTIARIPHQKSVIKQAITGLFILNKRINK